MPILFIGIFVIAVLFFPDLIGLVGDIQMKIGTICAIVGGSLVLLAGVAAGVLAYGFSVIDKEEEAMNPYRHMAPPSRGY